MASSDVNSAHAPQGQTGGDIEMGDVNNTNETPMATPSSPQEHEQVEEPHSLQAQATQPSRQVPAADETQSEPPQTHAPQGQDGGDIETEHANNANETPIATPPILQAHEIQVVESSSLPPQAPATQSSLQSEPTGRELFRTDRDLSVGLYKAALNGDWETAERLLGNDLSREILCASITKGLETALHVAAGARQTKFAKKLIGFMEPEDLALPDKNGNTALCLAAAAGAKSIAQIMIDKNSDLPTVRGNQGLTPLYMAAKCGQCEMVRFLHPKTEDILEREANEGIETRNRIGTELFFAYIDIGLFDLALKLLTKDSELAVIRYYDRGTALDMLARMPSAFPSKSPGIWKTLINSCVTSKHTNALKLVNDLWREVLRRKESTVRELITGPSSSMFEAAKLGNVKFLVELLHCYPDIFMQTNENGQTIFHVAVLHRQVSIFNLIHMIGSYKDIITTYDDDSRNNILHLAAELPHPSLLNVVSGAALQMQRELLWFQEVEKAVQPSYREKRNLNGKTPRELFTEKHKKLLKKGEKWMQTTATSYMLVATLITTVVFAAAFTVPGNYNDTGIPILLKEKLFSVFAISNAIAMIFSSTSILMSLSILTSSYTEEDFLRSLPSKLFIGLTSLFISIASMLLAFGTTFYLDYHHKSFLVSLIVASLALLPVILFAYEQRRLFFDVFRCSMSHLPV